MKTRAIIAGAVVLVVLLFVVMFATVHRRQPVTVRHVKSVQSGDVTTMTFEITNHTSHSYEFATFEIQVRDGSSWTTFKGFQILGNEPRPILLPRAVTSYSASVTNLLAGSVVRFRIIPQRILVGADGFARRVELDMKFRQRVFSLNPFDRSNQVYGEPTMVASEEWVEAVK